MCTNYANNFRKNDTAGKRVDVANIFILTENQTNKTINDFLCPVKRLKGGPNIKQKLMGSYTIYDFLCPA